MACKSKTGRTISPVVKAGLCTGCGTCAGVCPKRAIEMIIDYPGVYLPKITISECDSCGLCFNVCPGHSVHFKNFANLLFGEELANDPVGNHLKCYMGHATSKIIRHNAASGGMITQLLISALEGGLIDGALVTKMRTDKPLEPQSFIARNKAEIIAANKSKYCPVPANLALREIIEKKGNYAVVGLPCHIQGVRKACSLIPNLRNRIVLCLSLICGHTDTFYQTKLFIKKYCGTQVELKRIEYRGNGWPGSLRIYFNKTKMVSIPFEKYMTLHAMWFFSNKRCLVCCDSISKLSDITFMDAWLPEVILNDKEGTSLLIVRTKKGKQFCDNAQLQRAVDLQIVPSTKIINSQGTQRLLNKDYPVFLQFNNLLRARPPDYDLNFSRPSFKNYLRALLVYWNNWVSSQVFFDRYIPPLANIESTVISRKSRKG